MSVLTLYVDEVMRTLSNDGQYPFVVNDKTVDIVRFALNTGFTDVVLDENTALRVMYQRPGESQVRAQTLTYYDTDGLRNYYDWQLLSADLTKKGTLTVALCILRTDGDVEEWHTIPYQIRVLDTIHTDDSDEADETITPTVAQRVAVLESMIQRVASGAPIVVASTSAMTDTEQLYVLSTDRKWYYHNGTAWVAGGEYGAVATDTTLTQSGIPADAKTAGDEISAIKVDLSETNSRLDDIEAQFAGETTASGNVAHIVGASASENVKSLIVNITPLQNGSGDPSPSNVRTISGWTEVTITKWRKNMVGTLIADGKVPSVSTGALVNANGVRSDYIPVNPNTKYSFKYSGNFTGATTYMFFYDRNKKYLSNVSKGNSNEVSATTPENATYAMVRFGNVTDLSRVEWTQLEISQTPTEYEAVSKNDYTVNWNSIAGTVYGGTLDVITGELVVTHGFIASYSGQTINEPWISSKDVYVEGGTPTTGAQVVYPLTTPQTYSIEPVTVPQSEGINNYTANNVGGVSVVCFTESISVELPTNIKNALIACFGNVAWKDDDGRTYYNALISALNS